MGRNKDIFSGPVPGAIFEVLELPSTPVFYCLKVKYFYFVGGRPEMGWVSAAALLRTKGPTA